MQAKLCRQLRGCGLYCSSLSFFPVQPFWKHRDRASPGSCWWRRTAPAPPPPSAARFPAWGRAGKAGSQPRAPAGLRRQRSCRVPTEPPAPARPHRNASRPLAWPPCPLPLHSAPRGCGGHLPEAESPGQHPARAEPKKAEVRGFKAALQATLQDAEPPKGRKDQDGIRSRGGGGVDGIDHLTLDPLCAPAGCLHLLPVQGGQGPPCLVNTNPDLPPWEPPCARSRLYDPYAPLFEAETSF